MCLCRVFTSQCTGGLPVPAEHVWDQIKMFQLNKLNKQLSGLRCHFSWSWTHVNQIQMSYCYNLPLDWKGLIFVWPCVLWIASPICKWRNTVVMHMLKEVGNGCWMTEHGCVTQFALNDKLNPVLSFMNYPQHILYLSGSQPTLYHVVQEKMCILRWDGDCQLEYRKNWDILYQWEEQVKSKAAH